MDTELLSYVKDGGLFACFALMWYTCNTTLAKLTTAINLLTNIINVQEINKTNKSLDTTP